jgi:hypothetical protein
MINRGNGRPTLSQLSLPTPHTSVSLLGPLAQKRQEQNSAEGRFLDPRIRYPFSSQAEKASTIGCFEPTSK